LDDWSQVIRHSRQAHIIAHFQEAFAKVVYRQLDKLGSFVELVNAMILKGRPEGILFLGYFSIVLNLLLLYANKLTLNPRASVD
jgi:hypothetical protein